MVEVEAVVIGAGPAGLSAAIYLHRAGVSFFMLDKGAPGGKLLNVHEVANMPGFLPLSGTDLAIKLFESVSSMGIEYTYGDVLSVRKGGRGFIVTTDMEEYSCFSVLVATGFVYEAVVKGEKELRGLGISYCASCDGPLYKGKDVLVYGEGSRAEEEYSYLKGICSKVYFLSKNKVDESLQSEDRFGESEVLSLSKNDEGKILVEASVKGEKKTFEVSAAFPLYGEKSALGFLTSLEVEEKRGFLIVDEHNKTSVEGLYAAGDIVDIPLRQVVTALGGGANAATAMAGYVRRRRKNG